MWTRLIVCACTSASGSILLPRIFVPLSPRSTVPVMRTRRSGTTKSAESFIEIGKDDDLNHTLEVFQGKIGHPVALLGQHAFDGRDDSSRVSPQRPSDNSDRPMVEAVASAWMVAS